MFQRIRNHWYLRKLAKELGYEDTDSRRIAAQILAGRAESVDNDISAAVPALAGVLRDCDSEVRQHAAKALARHFLRKQDGEKLLKFGQGDTRSTFLGVIQKAHEQAPWRVAVAMPLLESVVKDPGLGWKEAEWIARVATLFYLGRGRSQEIEGWMRNERDEIRIGTSKALHYAAKRGQDIADYLPLLVRALHDSETWVRKNAAEAICEAARHCQDITPLLFRILRGDFQAVPPEPRGNVGWTPEWFIANCDSLEMLDKAQHRVEQEFLEWWKRQPQHSTPKIQAKKIRVRMAVTKFLNELAKRKTVVASNNDGELLTGETVTRPTWEIKGMHRVVRARV